MRGVTRGVTCIPRQDVYLIAGPTGNDTDAFDPESRTWRWIDSGDPAMVNGYMEYDPAGDLTVMVYRHLAYRFRHVP